MPEIYRLNGCKNSIKRMKHKKEGATRKAPSSYQTILYINNPDFVRIPLHCKWHPGIFVE